MSPQVIDEIIAAFADVPRPTTLSHGENDDWEEGRITRQNLSGKDWREIDTALLHNNKAAFYGLTAEAYQYYLSVRMICSLDRTHEFDDVRAYTILHLLPNFWYLMYEGHDQQFNYRYSLLTDKQRYAVCSFLGTMFDEPYNYVGWCAQCVKWGWNIPDHPASAKIRDYYHSLHNFCYPPAISPKSRRLIDLIRNAFEDTPAPIDIFNREIFRKGDPEGPDYALEFQGLDWRTLHPNFVSRYEGALHFFSDEELRYFLPAFLIADIWITDLNDNTEDDIEYLGSDGTAIFTLTFELTSLGSRTDRINRFSKFTSIERQAIIAYLKFNLGQNTYRREQMEIKRALKYYWSKTV